METMNPFFDTDEEETEYYAVLDRIPLMGSQSYRSPLVGYKFDTSCEDMSTDTCRCIEFDEEQQKKYGDDFLSPYSTRFNPGMKWSDVMGAPESTLFSNEEVRSYI